MSVIRRVASFNLSFFSRRSRSLRSPAARCACARHGPPLGSPSALGYPQRASWGSSGAVEAGAVGSAPGLSCSCLSFARLAGP
eukprot:scaffold181323_cov46-Tisochrysis_lutea.AAC.1